MNQKVTNKYLSGTAIIAVPQEEIETILKHNFHCFKDAAKPREETHVFMHRFFEYLKKKKTDNTFFEDMSNHIHSTEKKLLKGRILRVKRFLLLLDSQL